MRLTSHRRFRDCSHTCCWRSKSSCFYYACATPADSTAWANFIIRSSGYLSQIFEQRPTRFTCSFSHRISLLSSVPLSKCAASIVSGCVNQVIMLNAAVFTQALGMMFYTISYSVFINNSGKHYEVSEREGQVIGRGREGEWAVWSTSTDCRCSLQTQSWGCFWAHSLPS